MAGSLPSSGGSGGGTASPYPIATYDARVLAVIECKSTADNILNSLQKQRRAFSFLSGETLNSRGEAFSTLTVPFALPPPSFYSVPNAEVAALIRASPVSIPVNLVFTAAYSFTSLNSHSFPNGLWYVCGPGNPFQFVTADSQRIFKRAISDIEFDPKFGRAYFERIYMEFSEADMFKTDTSDAVPDFERLCKLQHFVVIDRFPSEQHFINHTTNSNALFVLSSSNTAAVSTVSSVLPVDVKSSSK